MENQNTNIEIKTTGDLQLGVYPTSDEIGLFIHGYSDTANRLIADMVTITKEDARNLATIEYLFSPHT